MVGDEYLPMMVKRKAIDQINEDFSDFSLSSPARKIRRLDVDLPPIVEEDEMEMSMAVPVAEELKPEPVNEERAIVLFKPLESQQFYSGNLYVDTDLISGFKSNILRAGYLGDTKRDDDDDDYDENQTSSKCQAVIPWNPSIFPTTMGSTESIQQPKKNYLYDNDTTMEEATMEIDEENSSAAYLHQDPQFTRGIEGFHHWKQQPQQQPPHCMVPQPLPRTNSTPISWFR